MNFSHLVCFRLKEVWGLVKENKGKKCVKNDMFDNGSFEERLHYPASPFLASEESLEARLSQIYIQLLSKGCQL